MGTEGTEDLRRILNAWDPIGVFEPGEDPAASKSADEYDCVRDRLISALLRGGNRADVMAQLRSEVTDHIGLDASAVTDEVIDAVCAWRVAANPWPDSRS